MKTKENKSFIWSVDSIIPFDSRKIISTCKNIGDHHIYLAQLSIGCCKTLIHAGLLEAFSSQNNNIFTSKR